jgi:hypothetical protein
VNLENRPNFFIPSMKHCSSNSVGGAKLRLMVVVGHPFGFRRTKPRYGVGGPPM